jgi:hypothetical protein
MGQLQEFYSTGHKLEVPILTNWVKSSKEELAVKGVYTAGGLVAKKNHPWAKDSIDFLAVVAKR